MTDMEAMGEAPKGTDGQFQSVCRCKRMGNADGC